MLRFGFSLVVAALITLGGYSALGATATGSDLPVIAVVVAHAHHHSAVSAIPHAVDGGGLIQ